MGNRLLEAAKIANASIGFQTVFNGRLELGGEPIETLAMKVPSTGSEEEYDWLGDIPGMTEWLDDRAMSELRAEGFRLPNRDWANGIKVDKNTIADDKLGMVRPRIQMLADKARRHPGKLLADLLVNGFNGAAVPWSDGKCYDGQFFFSASHKDGSGPTQSNLSTAALSATSYEAAQVAMQSLADESGDYPIEVEPSLLVVGPSLAKLAKELVQSPLVVLTAGDGAVSNVQQGTARVMVSKRLIGSYANYWFLADDTQAVKPLIFQEREAVRFDALDDPRSDDIFMRKKLKYGASARYAGGYGLWQFCHGSNGTT